MKAPRSRKTYSLGDVMRLTGAKRPQIEYWVRKSIIRGEFEDGGTGLPRQFVFRNLVEVAVGLDLNLLGVSTEVMSSMIEALRYGDIETDVRTPGYVEMMRPRQPLPRFTKAERREMKAAFERSVAETPLEDHCYADLNDDGTLKLLRLLRAYVEEGVSDAEIRKGLLAIAREHLREHQQWQKEYDDLHRRWRAFKNPATRPRNGRFWIVCGAPDPGDDPGDGWRDVRLTDDRDKQGHARPTRSMIVVTLRPILEQLETATGDSWRATPEKKVSRYHDPVIPPRQLVEQAFREYERTEEIKARAAMKPLATVKEQSDVSA